MEFVDGFIHIYLDDFGTGCAIEEKVYFLSAFPELARKEYTLHVFKLCCLCLGLSVPNMPKDELGSGSIGTANVDMSRIIGPLQGDLFSSDAGGIFITDSDSIDGSLASLEGFSDKALQTDYNPWSLISFHDYERLYSELANSCKAVKIASDVESSCSHSELVFVSEKLPKQRCRPAERTRIDVERTQNTASTALLVDRLRSNRKQCGAQWSKTFF